MYNNVLMGRHAPIVKDKVPRLFILVVMATAARVLEAGSGGREKREEKAGAAVAVSLGKLIEDIFVRYMENTPCKSKRL